MPCRDHKKRRLDAFFFCNRSPQAMNGCFTPCTPSRGICPGGDPGRDHKKKAECLLFLHS